MLGKKQSGAEGWKRKRETEKEALISTKSIASFLKSSALNAAECVNSSWNKSDDGCQKTILKDGKNILELYQN